MTRPITDIVAEGQALGVVGGVAASLAVGATSEQIDDRVAALLAAGTNVSITYDDVAGTLTIAAAGGGGGGSVAVEDEGVEVLASATRFDFTGAGVSVTDGGAGQANVVIPGVTAPTWTSYTPTWTAVTTNPTIGNGSITGRYVQWGKTVHFWVDLTMGSTSTLGNGVWRFGLPVAASASYGSQHGILVTGYMENAGVAAYAVQGGRLLAGSTTAIELLHGTGTGGGASTISGGGPFTFGVGDYIRFSGQYEAA